MTGKGIKNSKADWNASDLIPIRFYYYNQPTIISNKDLTPSM
jgi:hypothetical protein